MVKKHKAQFVFYYLLSLISLGAIAISVGVIIFEVLNQVFQDSVNTYNSMSGLKTAFSTLFISTPIYYICSYVINKNIKNKDLSLESSLRKWLIYLILFVSSIIILVWLISILNNFLNGEMTVKFILKALTVLVISALIFTYYFYNIKQKEVKKKDNTRLIFFFVSLVLIIFTLTLGIFYMESPQKTRDRKMDEEILRNFDMINMEINNYYQREKDLPEDIDSINNSNLQTNLKNYINSESSFEYNKLTDTTYELCADFKTSNMDNDNNINLKYGNNRLHNSGYQCLEQEIRLIK